MKWLFDKENLFRNILISIIIAFIVGLLVALAFSFVTIIPEGSR